MGAKLAGTLFFLPVFESMPGRMPGAGGSYHRRFLCPGSRMSVCLRKENVMKKGKILKVRLGHEANCSSGMFLLMMLYLSAYTYLPTSLITSGIQAHQARRHGEINKKTIWIPQVIGLVFSIALFLIGITSGYDEVYLGMMAVGIGAAFAIAVYAGSKLAPQIGYWNILAVPLIQVALVFVLFWGLPYIYLILLSEGLGFLPGVN
jgi:hypothetical protein